MFITVDVLIPVGRVTMVINTDQIVKTWKVVDKGKTECFLLMTAGELMSVVGESFTLLINKLTSELGVAVAQ